MRSLVLFPGSAVPLVGFLDWAGLWAWLSNCSWSSRVSGCDPQPDGATDWTLWRQGFTSVFLLEWGCRTSSKGSTAPWTQARQNCPLDPWPDRATGSALQMGRVTGWVLHWGTDARRNVVCQDLSTSCFPIVLLCFRLILSGQVPQISQWSLWGRTQVYLLESIL